MIFSHIDGDLIGFDGTRFKARQEIAAFPRATFLKHTSRGRLRQASDRLAAKARAAVEAEVMPEHITAKATMKVRK